MTEFEKWINNAHMTDKANPYTNGAFDLLNSELVKELLVEAWFAGHNMSRYTPNPYGDAHRHAREANK